jgi:hypothetical protein
MEPPLSADLIARLIEAGTPAALIAEVAMALGGAAGDQRALAERRERDAARQREKRDRSRVTVRPRTARTFSPPPIKAPQTPKN